VTFPLVAFPLVAFGASFSSSEEDSSSESESVLDFLALGPFPFSPFLLMAPLAFV